MNKRFAISKIDTGEIVGDAWAIDAKTAAAQCEDGEIAHQVRRPISARDYINLDTGRENKRTLTPCIASRTTVPADGSTHVTLSRMRDQTHLSITGPLHSELVASGSEQLVFDMPGRYTITAQARFPALPKRIVIDAT